MTDSAPPAGITVTTKFFVLAFLLYFFKPVIHVDGSPPIKDAWGTRFFPVPPGQHNVRCYCPYLFLTTMGDSNITVDVPPGQVVDVTWNAPWLVFLMGKITATGPRPLAPADTAAAQQAVAQPAPQIQQAAAGGTAPAPAAAQPADWYPDPRSRHQLRYWDGNAWTDNVSDNGVTSTDPV